MRSIEFDLFDEAAHIAMATQLTATGKRVAAQADTRYGLPRSFMTTLLNLHLLSFKMRWCRSASPKLVH